MASQMVATSGNKRLRRDQVAAMEARLGYLPNIMEQKKSREQRAQDIRFRNREFRQAERGQAMAEQQAKDTLALEKKSQMMSAGVSAANLGLGVAGMAQKGGTLGRTLGSLPGGSMLPSSLGGATIGQGLTGGLMGFGASRFGGKSKGKKIGLGLAGGALGSLLGGGGFSAGGMGIGAMFGGLSGLI